MIRTCNNCVNSNNDIKGCMVLKERIPVSCFAWADGEIAFKQFTDMKQHYKTLGINPIDLLREEKLIEKRSIEMQM